MDLRGQRVVIAGGTSGIGLATARAAARAGAEVTVISRQQASVDRALADLPPGTRGRAGDLTDPALSCRLFDAATPHLDPGGSITLTSGTASHRDTAAAIPAGRVGEPDDIARAYLYCLTQPFATGSILTVDGGTVLA
jgi:NAD(P)-dependent dehydrogenase (short-subunit alcohol dehydrogenase family)